jgi:hypothetical protein
MDTPDDRDRIVITLIAGAAAGAAATWVMGKVTTWLYDNESIGARQLEDAARGGTTAYGAAAAKLAEASGVEITAEQRDTAGAGLHWALGVAGGAGYALARKRWPEVAAMYGVAFGLGFFLVFDELLNPVLGLTPGPAAFPWQAHARGLAGHLAYGVANNVVLDVVDRVM